MTFSPKNLMSFKWPIHWKCDFSTVKVGLQIDWTNQIVDPNVLSLSVALPRLNWSSTDRSNSRLILPPVHIIMIQPFPKFVWDQPRTLRWKGIELPIIGLFFHSNHSSANNKENTMTVSIWPHILKKEPKCANARPRHRPEDMELLT